MMALVIILDTRCWTLKNLTIADDEEKTFVGDYPFDLSAGKQLIFIYVNIIEYQNLGDTKAPLIRVIDSKQSLKNGSQPLAPVK